MLGNRSIRRSERTSLNKRRDLAQQPPHLTAALSRGQASGHACIVARGVRQRPTSARTPGLLGMGWSAWRVFSDEPVHRLQNFGHSGWVLVRIPL